MPSFRAEQAKRQNATGDYFKVLKGENYQSFEDRPRLAITRFSDFNHWYDRLRVNCQHLFNNSKENSLLSNIAPKSQRNVFFSFKCRGFTFAFENEPRRRTLAETVARRKSLLGKIRIYLIAKVEPTEWLSQGFLKLNRR